MVSVLLKKQIEEYYAHMKGTNPLFQNAKNGSLNSACINRYLAGVLFLIRHTPIHLRLAKMRALEVGQEKVANFYASKLKEEVGHDQWAREDMANIAKLSEMPASLKVEKLPPAVLELVTYIEKLIRLDPSQYLAYILLAEYFTVLAGPEWLTDLEVNCGIPRNFMSVIGKHADLDKAHVLDDLKEIDDYLDDSKLAGATRAIKTAMKFHEAFCSDVGRR